MLRRLLKEGAKVAERSVKPPLKNITIDGRILSEAEQHANLIKQIERDEAIFRAYEAARKAKDPLSDAKRGFFNYIAGGAAIAVVTAGATLFRDELAAKRKALQDVEKEIEDMRLNVDKIISHQLKGADKFAKEDHEKVLKYRPALNMLGRRYNKNDNIVVSARDVLLKITEAYENDDIELSAQERVIFRVTPEIQAMYRKKPQGFFAGTAAQALELADSSDSLDDDSVRSVMLPFMSNNS